MKRVNKHGKEFKIIPEAKLVRGETNKKLLVHELDGLPEMHRDIIQCISMWRFNHMHDRTFANAYCDDKDTFDENVGMMVCAAKLDKKNHLYLAKECEKIYEILMDCVKYLYNKREWHLEKAKSIEDDLIKTYGRLPHDYVV